MTNHAEIMLLIVEMTIYQRNSKKPRCCTTTLSQLDCRDFSGSVNKVSIFTCEVCTLDPESSPQKIWNPSTSGIQDPKIPVPLYMGRFQRYFDFFRKEIARYHTLALTRRVHRRSSTPRRRSKQGQRCPPHLRLLHSDP